VKYGCTRSESVAENFKCEPVRVQSAKYKPLTGVKDTLEQKPYLYAPFNISKVNYSNQPVDLIISTAAKTISEQVTGSASQLVKPSNGFLNYGICRTMEMQRTTQMNFRKEHQT
jgi:hypothetical protein